MRFARFFRGIVVSSVDRPGSQPSMRGRCAPCPLKTEASAAIPRCGKSSDAAKPARTDSLRALNAYGRIDSHDLPAIRSTGKPRRSAAKPGAGVGRYDDSPTPPAFLRADGQRLISALVEAANGRRAANLWALTGVETEKGRAVRVAGGRPRGLAAKARAVGLGFALAGVVIAASHAYIRPSLGTRSRPQGNGAARLLLSSAGFASFRAPIDSVMDPGGQPRRPTDPFLSLRCGFGPLKG